MYYFSSSRRVSFKHFIVVISFPNPSSLQPLNHSCFHQQFTAAIWSIRKGEFQLKTMQLVVSTHTSKLCCTKTLHKHVNSLLWLSPFPPCFCNTSAWIKSSLVHSCRNSFSANRLNNHLFRALFFYIFWQTTFDKIHIIETKEQSFSEELYTVTSGGGKSISIRTALSKPSAAIKTNAFTFVANK